MHANGRGCGAGLGSLFDQNMITWVDVGVWQHLQVFSFGLEVSGVWGQV